MHRLHRMLSACWILSLCFWMSGADLPGAGLPGAALANPTFEARQSLGDGEPSEDCADGVVVDDGTADGGFGWVPSVLEGRYVQEYRASQFPTRRLDSVCVCLFRGSQNNTDDTIDFEVVFYESVPVPPEEDLAKTFDRMPAREPYAAYPSTAEGVPQGASENFYEVDVNGVRIPTGTSYIGLRWNANADTFFFFCADENEETPPVNAYFRDEEANGWTSVFKTNDPIFDDHRAFLIRVRPSLETVVEIPTLGTAGSLTLLVLLAGLGWRRLRR